MKSIILAGGYATRLYPLTLDKPKALLEVKGKPLLRYTLDKLVEVPEIDEVFIVTNDRFYSLFSEWVSMYGKDYRFKIEVINDLTTSNETRLGGIGDLEYCIEARAIQDDILVLNSDNLFDFSLCDAVDFFSRNRNRRNIVNGVYLLSNREEVKRHGVVLLGEDARIIDFEEKPQNPRSSLISFGVYIIPRDLLPQIKKYLQEGNNKDAPGHLLKYLSERFESYGFRFNGRLFDIGNLQVYRRINEMW